MTEDSQEHVSPHRPHHQLILFGPPGTSKSRRARDVNAAELKASGDDIIPVMFHPDYSYGEFVARLLPISSDGRIHYNVHAGPFIRALSMAYVNLTTNPVPNIVLLIDEINRGNCAEIFGDVFQLLDRDEDGWSCYETSVSDLVIQALKDEMSKLNVIGEDLHVDVDDLIGKRQLKLPPNLYFIGTMNTSDESTYFMDSAFKRRWNFEFRSVGFSDVPHYQRDAVITETAYTWGEFIDALNEFILDRCTSSKMDDKLVGPWFIKARRQKLTLSTIAQKFPQECKDIEAKAAGVATPAAGADNSQRFEKAVLALVGKLPPTVGQGILDLAKYDPDANLRCFKAIESDAQMESYPYYLKLAKNPLLLGTRNFILSLKKLPAEEIVYEIDRSAIAGKLMLYLWDNVFDRDKSPLATLLGIESRLLRTFGQFTDLVDEFIERVCERASSELPESDRAIESSADTNANAAMTENADT
ncbi:MAG: AAA family ATPase [Curvibacter sp.]|nr:MAG: AAA family ATPase [Curvibacter sp.]